MSDIETLCQCRALTQFGGATADNRFSYPGSTPHYAPDRTFDTRHIKLEIALDFGAKRLSGTCTTTLEALAHPAQEMIFDAVDFRIRRVTANRRRLRYTYDRRKLKIQFRDPVRRGERIKVAIDYAVTAPKLGLHFVGPDKAYPNKPRQVWTQGEDEYNRYWFPCHDAPQERTTTEMIVTVPSPMTAVSNGALVRQTRRRGTRTFHYRHQVPHSPYLVSLCAGEFTEIKDRWRRVPVLYYVTPGREDDARRAFGKTPKMMEFFSRKTGVPYAYAKYAQTAAIDFIYGGMENTTCTTQTALTLHDERAHLDFSSDPLVAHELAHQWFGDLVTCKDWSHAWLNESFATYFEALFKEHDLGLDEFMYELRGNAEAYFDEDKDRYRRPMVTRLYKNTNDLFDRHLYEKGSLILHMLRRELGEDAWWRSIHLYLKTHRGRCVETVDLINAIQDATGRNLRPFFDQWIFKGGHPELKVRFWWDAGKKKVHVRVLQTQTVNDETALFTLPLAIDVVAGGKTRRFSETISKKDQRLSLDCPAEPDLVLVDPDHALLKKIDIAKSEPMWIRQLTEDPSVLGRIDAAAALRPGSPAAIQALRQALAKEPFWGVRVEVARALGRMGAPQAMDALLFGLRTVEHPKVRRAIYEALGSYPSSHVTHEIRLLIKDEPTWLVEAEAIKTLGRMKDTSLLSLFKAYLKKDSWNDVLRMAALEAIANLQASETVAILKAHTRYGFHPSTRMTAVRRLAGLGRGRDDIQSHLVRMLSDSYLLVQLAVVRALGSFADERAVPALMKLTTGDRDGRLKRAAEEAVRKIRKGMDDEFPSDRRPGRS